MSHAHPVDEVGLDKFDHLQRHEQTNGNQVVEEDDEGEEVETKVRCTAVWQSGEEENKERKKYRKEKKGQYKETESVQIYRTCA